MWSGYNLVLKPVCIISVCTITCIYWYPNFPRQFQSLAYKIPASQRLHTHCFSHNTGNLFPCCITLKMWLFLECYCTKRFRYLAKSKSVKLEQVRVLFSASSANSGIVQVPLGLSLYRATPSLHLSLGLLVVYHFASAL